MRVALFTDADVFAGTERHLIALARGLKASGAEVSVACPPSSPVAEMATSSGVRVIGIGKKSLFDNRAILKLLNCLSTGELEIIHAHNGRTAFLAAIAKTLARRGRVVATQHFLAPAHSHRRGPSGALSLITHRWISRTADHHIAISQAVRNAMLERAEAAPNKITVVHNGIPAPDRSELREKSAVKAALGIDAVRPLIVCAARLEPEKDIDTLIQAMKIVSQHPSQPFCVIAGEGTQRARLEQEIQHLRLIDSVALLGFQQDTLSLINACDLLVLPSLAEPFGLAILEAMSLGKPVIATDVGGPLEIVQERETGLFFPAGNAECLAKAILTLTGNTTLALQMGTKGKSHFHANFSVERMVRSTLAIYSQIARPSAA